LTLRHSPARQRLCAAEREHERLLNEIRKKKLARDTSESTARDAARALDARLGPLRQALCAVVTEVQAIFTSLLGADSRLSRRDKVRVRRAYGQLLPEPDVAQEAGPTEAERPAIRRGARRAAARSARGGRWLLGTQAEGSRSLPAALLVSQARHRPASRQGARPPRSAAS
jgi:hypothetical protein